MISVYPSSPGHQATDTSIAAAEKMSPHAVSLREQCLNLLQAADYTPDEIAKMLRKSVLAIRPRFSELAAEDLIFDSGERRKNDSGHGVIVWTTGGQRKLI